MSPESCVIPFRASAAGADGVAVATDELAPCRRPCRDRLAQRRERRIRRELRIETIVSQHRARCLVHLRPDVLLRLFPVGAEQPVNVARYPQASHGAAVVPDRQHLDLYRVFNRHSHAQRGRDAFVRVLENRIAGTVFYGIRSAFPDRLRSRRPDVTVVVVADVDAFAGRIFHRVVGPRRETVGAVRRPHCPRPALAHTASRRRISDDVYPRRRWKCVTGEAYLVFARRC